MVYTKIVKSGTLVEIYEYEKAPNPRRPVKKRKRSGFAHTKRSVRNVERARLNFFRLVRANLDGDSPPSLITLTHAEIVDFARAWGNFKIFTTKWRAKRKRLAQGQPAFVAVPELQKRGSVHFHMLVWGLSYDEIVGEYFSREIAKCWGHGFVDCRATDGSHALAGYFAKYFFKAVYDSKLPSGRKLYSCSRGLVRPVSGSTQAFLAIVKGELEGGVVESDRFVASVDNSIAPEKDVVYTTPWLGRCNYKRYTMKYENGS